jgi:hypothetical protein
MRMQSLTRRVLGAAAFAAFTVAGAFGVGGVPTQQAKLTASDAADGDYLGYAVAADGGTAVVGAHGKNALQGAAYVFARTGTAWTEQGKLTAADGAAGDYFGTAVAVSDDAAVVGAYFRNSFEGAAYVFRRTGTSWAPEAKLMAADAAVGQRFGWKVAISGGTAVIGAPYDDSNRGAAYVFTRTGATWTQQKLTASDGAGFEYFGFSVAVAGDTLVIGTPRALGGLGAAYVFTRTGTTWTQQAKLAATDGVYPDQLGRSVALSGDTAVVGASFVGSTLGAAYVFTRTAGTWTQQAKLTVADATAGDYLGESIAVAGDTVFAGVAARSASRGVVYVFSRSGTDWTQQSVITAADAAAGDNFGVSVAVAGDTVVCGAYAGSTSRGAAYVFTGFAPPPSGYVLATQVSAKANVKRPERSVLTASGTLDTGSGAPDFSGAATFEAGGFHLDVPAFVTKGKSLTYGAAGVTLTITPATNGSSRSAFSVRAVGDLGGKVLRDGPLDLRFKNAAHDLNGTVVLTKGVLGPHCVAAPDLCVRAAAATVKGGGKDSLTLTLGFATDGTVPPAAADMTIGFGDAYTSPRLLGGAFVRRRNADVFTSKGPGITKVTVDYMNGTITIAGSRLDLGDFPQRGNPVSLTIARGADTQSVGIRMSRAGTKLTY